MLAAPQDLLNPESLTPGSLFAGFFLSSVGLVLFLYGKKQTRVPQLASGMVLMALPFVLPTPLPMLGVGALVMVALRVWLRCE